MARNPDRIPEVLRLLSVAWQSQPDLRLGQLLSNLVDSIDSDIFYIEDSQLAYLLADKLAEMPKKK